MFRLVLFTCLLLPGLLADSEWHRNALVYQVYPRSFKDSNGDGIGDLNGITNKLEHIADIGATALWLSPIYKSPQVDFGYDISNFTDVDPDYGTLADFAKLVAKAKLLGLKVILDFVPNHSSHEHPWFKKSIQRIKPYDEFYIWRDAKIVNGTRRPPNNWLSNFQGSAWTWNDVRKQYYLHQFTAGQPDLNYRSLALNQEMKNVLTFWMNRGVDGFRIDAINFLIEDSRFPDEPKSKNPVVSADDYEGLEHIYTKDQPETYEILRTWRKLMDNYTIESNSSRKMILTEAYTTKELTMKYYEVGSTAPFNFMFITDLTNTSTAPAFKRAIDDWLNNIPRSENVANWVVGKHDNHRVASRFGSKRADQISLLSMILPGISVVYNGDEIGMVDRLFTYKETVDTAGCNAGPSRYYLKSRDPERTPFQWDNTTSAGFSTRQITWLPVNSNYKTLNLEAQKLANVSHYQVFKDMALLKKTPLLKFGSVQVTLVTEKVLGVVRKAGIVYAVLLINFSDAPVTVDASTWLNIPKNLIVYTGSVGSNYRMRDRINMSAVTLRGAASVVFVTPNMTPVVLPNATSVSSRNVNPNLLRWCVSVCFGRHK